MHRLYHILCTCCNPFVITSKYLTRFWRAKRSAKHCRRPCPTKNQPFQSNSLWGVVFRAALNCRIFPILRPLISALAKDNESRQFGHLSFWDAPSHAPTQLKACWTRHFPALSPLCSLHAHALVREEPRGSCTDFGSTPPSEGVPSSHGDSVQTQSPASTRTSLNAAPPNRPRQLWLFLFSRTPHPNSQGSSSPDAMPHSPVSPQDKTLPSRPVVHGKRGFVTLGGKALFRLRPARVPA